MYKKQLNNRLQNAELQLISAVKTVINKLSVNIATSEGRLKNLSASLGNIFKVKCLEGEHCVNKIMARIDANNPIRILGQGYSKLYGEDGFATDIDKVNIGENITILTQGGKICAEVKNKTAINK